MPTSSFLRSCCGAFLVFGALTLAAFGENSSGPSESAPAATPAAATTTTTNPSPTLAPEPTPAQIVPAPAKAPTFRQSNIALPPATPAASHSRAVDAQTDLDDLDEKRHSLESELRYGRSQLEAAQHRLAIQSEGGNVEQADRLGQEIRDWEARIREKRKELDQVIQEIQGAGDQALTGEKQVIVSGENLEVWVVEDSTFNGRYEVRRGGYIIIPQVGRIPVAGKTISQAESAVRRALQASQLQRATVMIERVAGSDIAAGPHIFLAGEFKKVGQYRIPPGTTPTLINMMLSLGAAGWTEKADLEHVRVMRIVGGKTESEEVNVARVLRDGGNLGSDITLQEGDVVTLPAGESNRVYLTGRVNHQGSFYLSRGEKLLAYAAILQTGGFARFADQRRVYILRALPDGTRARIKVDVVAISAGKHPDVELMANDIIVVPEKFFSF